MSYIQLPSTLQNAKVDVFTRTDGSDTLAMQSFVRVDPTNGRALSMGANVDVTPVTAANNDLFSIDSGSFTYLTVQLTGTWAGTVTFQASNDGTNWVSCSALNSAIAAYVSTTTANGIFYIPVGFKYIRARATAYTSGTISASVIGATDVASISPGTVTATVANATLAAGTALVGDVAMGVRATTTNSASRLKVISAASTNATSVKATAGRVYGYQFSNTTASYKFVKLHNLATAPTVGTTAVIETIAVPPNNCINIMNPFGVYYSAGIALSITGAYADADTTAVAAGDVIGALIYA